MIEMTTPPDTEPADGPGEWVPKNLDTMPPGPVLDGFLSSVNVDGLSAADRVRVLRARQRLVSHHSARLMAEMASVVDGYITEEGNDPTDPEQIEWAATEVRTALNLTRAAADDQVCRAIEMRTELPQVTALLESGDIDVARLRTIHRSLTGLTPQIKTLVADAIVQDAPHLTTGQLRARIRKLAMEVEPDTAELQYDAALEQRRIEVWANSDGTGNLQGSNLPPGRLAEIQRRINDTAKRLRRDGETRTMDQLRTDIFLDLLAGTETERIGRGVVDIRVDLDTLAGLTESTGDLNGYGPVIADIARKAAQQNPDAEWRFMVTDPDTGLPIAVDTTRRRPTTDQRRFLEMFHPQCAFPGCRMPATESDMDHRNEHTNGGPTAITNLIPLCRHDHRIRHQTGWTHQVDDNGNYLWTSPLGNQYTVNRTTRTTAPHNPTDPNHEPSRSPP